MALDGATLREHAGPLLRALVERTGLTAHMAILEDNQAVLIARAAPPGSQSVATWLGKRIDVHCTSLGKCLLAYLADARVERLVREHGLFRHNENTIASLPRLKQDLSRTRERGYAVDDEEEEIGVRCIGVPVLGTDGSVLAAISLSGSTERIHSGNYAEFAAQLKHTASDIAERLGASAEARL
jgi:DNA-binding IclR family transcriptional regulator